MNIVLTDHFKLRFSQRVAKSKRIIKFASRAKHYGKDVCDIKDGILRKELLLKEEEYGCIAKVYSNYIYWFSNDTAITVYAVPQKFHGRV